MKLKCFLFNEVTEQGYKFLCTGICSQYAEQDIKNLSEQIKKIKLKVKDDPFYIDYILAIHLQKVCAETIYGVGLTIKIPGIIKNTGGVIGNPHMNPTSAEGLSENIGHGLSTAAYSGGPGIIIEGSIEHAEKILRAASEEMSGMKVLELMKDKAVALGINKAIMICDGSGIKSSGCALTLYNNKTEKLTLSK
ncbi:hypothetical protein OW763_07125 [Clostridium aestuarii]|uniref:Uncharacterized protein n=1 Tax=Clostridium aestuarii TaxID=338193 RepID=A0ABT4CYR8_9CLOT|nr:hypothetical protein [Clostridium aestuarii]MCY6484124.1 hypothetical protein [Clostridium aestuarii]